jgi:hypothetical protein
MASLGSSVGRGCAFTVNLLQGRLPYATSNGRDSEHRTVTPRPLHRPASPGPVSCFARPPTPGSFRSVPGPWGRPGASVGPSASAASAHPWPGTLTECQRPAFAADHRQPRACRLPAPDSGPEGPEAASLSGPLAILASGWRLRGSGPPRSLLKVQVRPWTQRAPRSPAV